MSAREPRARARSGERAEGDRRSAQIGLVYKTSFDKANRTRACRARYWAGASAADLCRNTFLARIACVDHVHEAAPCAEAAQAVDVCRSGVPVPADDLLLAAAATGKAVNVKKGQFLAPWEMTNVVSKITGVGNPNVLVTERGASFGYNTLVSDMRALPIMAQTTGAPVIFDATHSVQQPGGKGPHPEASANSCPCWRARRWRRVAGVFIQTHPIRSRASDGPHGAAARVRSVAEGLMDFDALARNASF